MGTSHCPDTQLQSETEGHHECDAAVQRSSALLQHSGGSIGAAPSTSPQLLRIVSGPAPSSSSPSVVKGWCGLHHWFSVLLPFEPRVTAMLAGCSRPAQTQLLASVVRWGRLNLLRVRGWVCRATGNGACSSALTGPASPSALCH